MKYKFTFFLLFAAFFAFAQNEFITIWKPTNPSATNLSPVSTNTQLYFPGVGNNYTIYWEEVGNPTHHQTLTNVNSAIYNKLLVDFGTGITSDPSYLIKVSEGNGTFSHFYSPIGDRKKLLEVKQWGTIKWSTMENAFSDCSNMDVTATDIPNLSNTVSFLSIFDRCTSFVGNATIGLWNTSKVNNMNYAFDRAENFNQNIGNWNLSNVLSTSQMFRGCVMFNQDIGNWDTSNVYDMRAMFANTTNFNQDIGRWNISNVYNTTLMFNNAVAFNQNIGNWNTSNIKTMDYMFSNTTNFNQNIGSWNTSKVQNMSGLFYNAKSFNQNIGNWDTSNVYNMEWLFFNAIAFNQSLEKWNLKSVFPIDKMFKNSNLSCENYDKTLIGWKNNPESATDLEFTDNTNMVYSSQEAVNARNYLINTKGWTISGDIYNQSCALATNNSNINQIQIYPNPAKETIHIKSKIYSDLDFKITDISGRLILKGKLSDHRINIQTLKTGSYILELSNLMGEKIVQKLLKE